jgi:hypothetical protein
MLLSGSIGISPEEYTCFYLNLLVFSISLTILTLFFNPSIYYVIIPFSLLISLLPIALPKLIVETRKLTVESEFPFFLLLAYILSFRGGPHIEGTFDVIYRAGESNFKALSREGRILERSLYYTPGNRLDIIEKTLGSVPSRTFSSFIHNYMTTLRSGGKISSFLLNEASMSLNSLISRWDSFVKGSSTLLEVSFVFLAILPIGLEVLYSTISVSEQTYLILTTTSLLLASVATLTIFEISQPRLADERYPAYAAFFLISALAFLVSLSMNGLLSLRLLFLISLFISLVYLFFSHRFFSLIYRGEEEAALFLHRVSEYSKAGTPPVKILQEVNLSKEFHAIRRSLIIFMNLLVTGSKPVDAVKKIRFPSWLVRYSFLLAAVAFEVGAGYEQIERAYSLFKSIASSKRLVRSSTIPFLLTGCIIPPLSLFGVWFLSRIKGSIFQFAVGSFSIVSAVLAVYMVSVAIGIILSKFYSLSIRSMYALPLTFLSMTVGMIILGIG